MAKAKKKSKAKEHEFVPIKPPIDWMDELLKKEGREDEIPKQE